MTGFDDFLETVPLPHNPNVADVVDLIGAYRRSFRGLRMPYGGQKLKRIREQRLRPASRIVVTDDRILFDDLLATGDAYPLLLDGFARYDFSPVWGLDVLYVLPDKSLSVFDIANQIAESYPSALALMWPCETQETTLWN